MHFLKTTSIFFLLITFFASCDPASNIKYEIVNKTTGPIKVKYQFAFNSSGDTSSHETIISADSSKIVNQDKPLGYVTTYNERHDSIFLYQLTIQGGNKMTHQNFKEKKYWNFIQEDEQNATYKLIIDSLLFDKY